MSTWCSFFRHADFKSYGVKEVFTKISETRQYVVKMAFYEVGRVKLKVQWTAMEVGDARKVEYLLRKVAANK